MSKSVLYSVNSTPQNYIANGTVINFGAPVRRYGQNIDISGGNVVVAGTGYYSVDLNIGFTSAAGDVTVQVYKDGVAIQGAMAIVTAAATTSYSLTIPTLIRETCDCESTITVVISGTAGTVNNASILVEKE